MSNWSDRVAEIDSFKVMDLLKRAKELDALGHDVVHMCAGEPDFSTPEPVAEAGMPPLGPGILNTLQRQEFHSCVRLLPVSISCVMG